MPIIIRKIIDKIYLPLFYGICIIGLVIAIFFFIDVKQQQREALLAYEKNLNIKKANETLKLEARENISNEDLIYVSSDESIIKVDEFGNLISVGEGSATLTITTKDKKHKQSLIVNVGQNAINKYLKENPKDNKETAQTTPIDELIKEETNGNKINK